MQPPIKRWHALANRWNGVAREAYEQDPDEFDPHAELDSRGHDGFPDPRSNERKEILQDLALRFPIDDVRQIPWILSHRGPGSEAGCCSRNSSRVPPVRLSCCPPPLPAARAVPRPPPATAPMAAPLPPPAMAPKAEPNPAPVATLRAVRPPCPCPCSR